MKLVEFVLKNKQITILVLVMIMVLGLTSLQNIPKSEDPDVEFAAFPIVVIYPGTSPKDMEDIVVEPIERRINSLENIKRIRTKIGDGFAIIQVEYIYGSDPKEKYQEVIREVNAIRNELPNDIYSIEVQKLIPSNVNILQTALISENANYDLFKKKAEELRDQLEKLPELKNVKIYGLPEKSIRVELQLEKMSQLRIPLDVVINTIQTESINIPGGNIEAGSKTFNIQTSGNYKNPEEIKNTIVYSIDNKNIYLKDIANVYFDFEKQNHITRLNAHRSVFIVAAQKPNGNINETKEAYLPVLEKFKKSLPQNMDFIVNFDQADNVNKRLTGLGLDFLIAILLVFLTLLPLGNRASLIVMISIPLSLAIGITLTKMLGYSLNQLSIVGFIVALGLLVDDSIVVVENIERWLREGHPKSEAILKATKQIGLAVLGCTAALIIAFLPLVFMPESTGDFIRNLPMTVLTTVFASMFVSLTFIPFLASRILKDKVGNHEGNIFLRGMKIIISGSYTKLLNKALKHPVITVVVTVLIFVGSLSLFKVIGFSLFPASEKPQFLIEITTPLQSNIEYTNQIAKNIESELQKLSEVKYFSTNVGKGNPQIFYNVLPENERSDYSQIFVQLNENIKPDEKLKLIEKLRQKWTPYPGAEVKVKNFEQGMTMTAPVEIRILGENLDTLRSLAFGAEKLLNRTAGTIYTNNPLSNLKSDLKININKEKANILGISSYNIDRIIRLAVAGYNVGKMIDENGKNFPIIVTKTKEYLNSLDAFKNLYFNNRLGNTIPLSQFATLEFTTSPLTINRLKKVRNVSVTSFVQKGFLASNVIVDVMKEMDKMNLPAGYRYEMGGEAEQAKESFKGFSTILLVTLFLFLGVLLLEFKTFKSTFIVLSVIPLGIVGATIALFLTGNSLSFVAVIGLIALAGIEVKNTILLVDFTNQLREQGVGLDEAIQQAGEVRFLPVVLTSLTAIGGLLPIALSINPLISPLAIVIIGGLISSTLLSRIVTPVVYKLIPPKIILNK